MKIFLKKIRHFLQMVKVGGMATRSYVRYCGFYEDTLVKSRWRMLLLAHSLEKGLGMENGRKDFGVQKAKDLLRQVEFFRKHSGDASAFEYREAVSVLQAHKLFREKNGLDISMYQGLNTYVNAIEPVIAGYETVTRESMAYFAADFERLCAIRHSVRSFNGQSVTKEELSKVVALMRTAPTACNRQMVKVYCTMDQDKNRELARLVPGNTGFEDSADKYVFLTADMTAFDGFEVDQWYINGGICAGFLQLAFSAYQIGSCIFQWPRDTSKDKIARRLLEIPDNEAIVAALGIGHYKDEFKVLACARKEISEFIHYA